MTQNFHNPLAIVWQLQYIFSICDEAQPKDRYPMSCKKNWKYDWK